MTPSFAIMLQGARSPCVKQVFVKSGSIPYNKLSLKYVGFRLKDQPPKKKARCAMDFCVISVLTTFLMHLCLLSGFRLFSTSFPHGNTKKNKVHAHIQHVRRKAKKLSPIHSFCLFLVSTQPSKWRGQKGGELDRRQISQHTAQACAKPSKTSSKFGLKIKPP
jgi:hypothetical protein